MGSCGFYGGGECKRGFGGSPCCVGKGEGLLGGWGSVRT